MATNRVEFVATYHQFYMSANARCRNTTRLKERFGLPGSNR
jgi:hypothetical protein